MEELPLNHAMMESIQQQETVLVALDIMILGFDSMAIGDFFFRFMFVAAAADCFPCPPLRSVSSWSDWGFILDYFLRLCIFLAFLSVSSCLGVSFHWAVYGRVQHDQGSLTNVESVCLAIGCRSYANLCFDSTWCDGLRIFWYCGCSLATGFQWQLFKMSIFNLW